MIIPSADVGVDYHICRLSFQCKVIHCKQLRLHIIQINAKRLIPLFCRVPYDSTPCAVIKLQIAAACIVELLNHILICLANILNQLLVCCINLSCSFVVCRHNHLLKGLRRCGNGIFGNCVFILKLFQKFEIFHKRMCLRLNLSYQIGVLQQCQLSVKLHAVACVLMCNAFKAPHEIQMPESSSELPVCNHMVAQLLLLCHNLCNLFLRNPIKCLLADFSCLICRLCVLQRLRS